VTITGLVHDRAKYQMVTGSFNWATMAPRAALVLAGSWTPAASNNYVQDAISAGATELAVSGYTRQSLTGLAETQDDAHTRSLIGASVFQFVGMASGGSFDTLILFNLVTTDSDSWLIATYSLGMTYTTAATGTLIFSPNAAGILAVT
jgi:hypothetical protein